MSGEIEMLGYGFFNPFWFNGRPVVIDPSVWVPIFTYILLATDLAAYKINAVVSVAGCIPKYFVRATCDWTFKTVGAGTVFAHQASAIGTNIEATIRQTIFQFGAYHHVLEILRVSEGSHERIFEYLAHSFVGEQYRVKSTGNRAPMVTTYHPVLNDIANILKKHIPILHTNKRSSEVFKDPPAAFIRSRYLKDMMVQTKCYWCIYIYICHTAN
jgi:hypothetical protein